MGKAIAFVSGKGGVGKTTLCAAVGMILSKKNKVLLIDCDFGMRNLDIPLDLSDSILYDLYDIMTGGCTVSDALLVHDFMENLSFIPASQKELPDGIGNERFAMLINELKKRFDFILIDCPAGAGRYVKMATGGADEIMVTVTPDRSSVRDADRAAYVIEETDEKPMKVIINRLDTRLMKSPVFMNIDDVIDGVRLPLAGVVPFDVYIQNDVFTKRGFRRMRNLSRTALENIAGRICGERIPLVNID